MDPVTLVTSLFDAIIYLRSISAKVKENKEECLRLADYTENVLKLIEEEISKGATSDVVQRLGKVKRTLTDLNSTLEELAESSTLKRLIWRDDIARRIAEAYKDIDTAVQLFNIGSKLDLRRVQAENEVARQADAAKLMERFEFSQKNDYEVMKLLEIHKAQMQEAMIALHKHLLRLEDPIDRQLLEGSMNAMQRRSGGLRTKPDSFVVTSLDVIIYHDKKIGEGGFGHVYEADWGRTRVAVKILDKGTPPFIFQKEIEVWKELRHPNILQFFGACSIADPPFSVCALKAGGDAMSYLYRNPSADRTKIVFEVSLGLAYLHNNAVIHGDLKASNILIDEHGVACLCDFGLSKIRTHTTTIQGPSSTTAINGTVRWMSPEQMAFGITNRPSDVYSFGMSLYEIFSGLPPFGDTIDAFLFLAIVDRGLRPPRPHGPRFISLGLTDVMWSHVEECWSQEAKDRPVIAVVASRLASQLPVAEKPQPKVSTEPSPTSAIRRHRPLPTPPSPVQTPPAPLRPASPSEATSPMSRALPPSPTQGVAVELSQASIAPFSISPASTSQLELTTIPAAAGVFHNKGIIEANDSLVSESDWIPIEEVPPSPPLVPKDRDEPNSSVSLSPTNDVLLPRTELRLYTGFGLSPSSPPFTSSIRTWKGWQDVFRRRSPSPVSPSNTSNSSLNPFQAVMQRAEQDYNFSVAQNFVTHDIKTKDYISSKHADTRKIVVAGDGACGKTFLIWSWIGKRTDEMFTRYPDGMFTRYEIDVHVQRCPVTMMIQDTCGQEDFDRFQPLAYSDADVVVVTYAIDSFTSLENLAEKWEPLIRHSLPTTSLVLLGCKKDLRVEPCVTSQSDDHVVTYEEGLDFAVKMGAVAFMECSSMTGEGVMESLRLASMFALEGARANSWRRIFKR